MLKDSDLVSPRSRPPHVELKRQPRVVTSPPGILQHRSEQVPTVATSIGGPSTSTGRLLPYVGQRYVVPPGRSLSEARRWTRSRGVSFKDADVILTAGAGDDDEIDENGVDVIDGPETSREEVEDEEEEEEEGEDLLDDLPPPADLIDIIGPAPDQSSSTISRITTDDIPEPAPRDLDLLMNMVTYREQSSDTVDDKAVDDFSGSYYPEAVPIDRMTANFGSLRRNGHMSQEAASRFTYGKKAFQPWSQMSRFQMSDPATSSSSYGRPRHQRSSSQQYDMSYFDSDATTVDEFAYSGRRERQAMNSSDSDDAYRRYRHLSDNQSNNLHYYSNGRDKQSPSSYRLQGKPLDSDALTYGGDRPEEELYQNVVGVRRSSRDEYSRNGLNDFCGGSNVPNSRTGNGFLSNDYSVHYNQRDMAGDRTHDFSNHDPLLNQSATDWTPQRDPYSVQDGGSRIAQDNVYMNSYDSMTKMDQGPMPQNCFALTDGSANYS